ncbi:MAG: phosphopentomutase [Lachnospiraceae bacterium]|nr:phosphopentomutase [Lachnospiraceae bacterium]
MRRVIWIVLDSVGMGELPDAAEYGDVGSNTLGNIAKKVGLKLPNMRELGLGNIYGMDGVQPVYSPKGCFGRLAEISKGKDTTTGHWEMIGIISEHPFPTYPDGFPKEIIDAFCKAAGVEGVLGNCVASGTKIIEELGEEHLRTGYPIVYTSADSVFQIACHESIYPPEKLYEICEAARELLTGEHGVGRVIARPFIGNNAKDFTRTSNRRDFSLKPPKDNLLVKLTENNVPVMAVGKIEDIFCGEGITYAVHTKDNNDGIDKTIEYMENTEGGLIFTNLVEFDSVWGHRNNTEGYAKGLEDFDARLPEITSRLEAEDMLIITADHGCDPTTESTDHSREYVPVLFYGKKLKNNINLGTGSTFANIGQTVAEYLGIGKLLAAGDSLVNIIVE